MANENEREKRKNKRSVDEREGWRRDRCYREAGFASWKYYKQGRVL